MEYTMKSNKEVLTSDKAPKAVGPYSLGIQSGKFVFLSGQLGLLPESGAFVADDVSSQTKQAIENLKHILESAGLNLDNVVKTTVFLKDMTSFSEMNSVYAEYFQNEPPARSTIEVAALPKNGLVEIDAIAVAPD
jgi:2-iminobutanoate/2-iminopropanoate deaminase